MRALTCKQQEWVLYLILVILGLVAIGLLACSREDFPDPVENSGISEVGKVMFCYNRSDHNESFCIRKLTTELGSTIECVSEYGYLTGFNHLAGVEVGNKQFVFYHNRGMGYEKYWWISEIRANGQIGDITDGCDDTDNVWDHSYETLIGFRIGQRGFIFGQDSYGDHRWFIQEITGDGKLAPSELSSGTWKNYYITATPFYINGITYIYFQDNDDYWFIAHVSEDGRLYDTCDGTWEYNDFPKATSLNIGGQTFLFCQYMTYNSNADHLGSWFIRRINPDGTMGEETDSGIWNYNYDVITSYTYNNKACIFGHQNGGFYFIQEITANGKMGAELSHGGIDGDDSFFYPFTLYEPGNFRYVVGWEFIKATTGQRYTWSPMYYEPWTAPAKSGGGAALADINRDTRTTLDAVLMGIQDLPGSDRFYYQVAWDLDYTGKAAGWSKTYFGPYCGGTQAGGGADIADIDRNGKPDLVLMSIDDPEGANAFWYFIGWNLNTNGEPASWSSKFQIDGLGWDNAGGGMALNDIDGNGQPEIVLAAIDNPSGANKFWYKLGRNLDQSGNATSWTSNLNAPFNLGDLSAGGGAALADIDFNGHPDLVLMNIDSPQGANPFWCYVGWDIDINGNAVRWSSFSRSALGNMTSGGGAAIGNIDKDETMDLLLMTVDNPYGKD